MNTCYYCHKSIKSRSLGHKIAITDSFGSEKTKVYICNTCYEKKQAVNAKFFTIASAILGILGLLLYFFAQNLALIADSSKNTMEFGGVLLIFFALIVYLLHHDHVLSLTDLKLSRSIHTNVRA